MSNDEAITRMIAGIREQRTGGEDRRRELRQMVAEITMPLHQAIQAAQAAIQKEPGLEQAKIVLNDGPSDENKVTYQIMMILPDHAPQLVVMNIAAKTGHVDMHWQPILGGAQKVETFAKKDTDKMSETILSVAAAYYGKAKGAAAR